MSKTTFTPPLPHAPDPTDETIKKLQSLSRKEKKQLKETVKAATKEPRERQRKQTINRRKLWWKNNWIALLGTIFAFIAAIPVIIEGIEAILQWLGQLN